METVAAYEAKIHLPRLLDKVARGESVMITKHGVPVAMLVPVPSAQQRSVREAIEAIEEIRKDNSLDGLTIRQMVEEGRR